jgi:hypothetical protein
LDEKQQCHFAWKAETSWTDLLAPRYAFRAGPQLRQALGGRHGCRSERAVGGSGVTPS